MIPVKGNPLSYRGPFFEKGAKYKVVFTKCAS